MKKLYLEPEFDIVNIRLVADILLDSREVESEVTSEDLGDFVDPFE